jgi:hypothetical protein
MFGHDSECGQSSCGQSFQNGRDFAGGLLQVLKVLQRHRKTVLGFIDGPKGDLYDICDVASNPSRESVESEKFPAQESTA